MKSAMPKVLHAACGLPLIEHVLRAADPLSPATIVVVVGHEAELVKARLGQPSLDDVCRAGAAAGHGPRAAAGRAGACRHVRDGGRAVRGRAAAPARDARAPGPDAPRAPGRRDRADGYRRPTPRLRPDRPRRTAASPRSSRTRTRRPTPRRSARSTAASTPSIWRRCSTRCAGSGPRTRRASTTCPISSGSIASAACRSRPCSLDDPTEILGVNSRRELADVAARLRDRKNDELMAAGVTIVDPGDDLHRAGRRRSAPTRSSIPACTSRDAPRSARAARSTPASASSTRRSATTCS